MPDTSFFATVSIKTTKYLDIENSVTELKSFGENSLSILHLNRKSADKMFENCKNLLPDLNLESKDICLKENWYVTSSYLTMLQMLK